MTERVCAHCGGSMAGMRPQARFCTPAHRAAASRVRAAQRSDDLQLAPEPTVGDAAAEKPHVRFLDGSAGVAGVELVPKREIAAAIGVSERTIERWMATRGLPCERRRNGRVLFCVEACQAWCRQSGASAGVRRAVCAACGYTVHVDGHWIAEALPSCACGAGPLHLVGCGS